MHTQKIKKNITPHVLTNMKQDLSNPLPKCRKRGEELKTPGTLFFVHCFSHLFWNSCNWFCNATPPKTVKPCTIHPSQLLCFTNSELIATTSKEFVFAESVNPFIMLNGEEITTTYQYSVVHLYSIVPFLL
jgi:hypothetical protein